MTYLNDDCCICLNNTDNTKLKKCKTCINSVCDDCINNINIDLDIDEYNEAIELTYKCPCCYSVNILNETHKDYSTIYKNKTTDLIIDLLEIKKSFIFVKNQMKHYESIIENKYYEMNKDVLTT